MSSHIPPLSQLSTLPQLLTLPKLSTLPLPLPSLHQLSLYPLNSCTFSSTNFLYSHFAHVPSLPVSSHSPTSPPLISSTSPHLTFPTQVTSFLLFLLPLFLSIPLCLLHSFSVAFLTSLSLTSLSLPSPNSPPLIFSHFFYFSSLSISPQFPSFAHASTTSLISYYFPKHSSFSLTPLYSNSQNFPSSHFPCWE